MLKNEISQRKKVILFALLIVLNIILRIPSIPHEKGADSFFIHSLANSITQFGQANWWLNWLSVFGLYPYSYASAIPFSLSGTSQLTGLTGLEMEKAIFLFSMSMGLFSIFAAYILAGAIYNEFLFKYITALFFSISQGAMVFTTWEISARGPFIIFFPFFMYILLKKIKIMKTLLLLVFVGIFLASIHHYFYFIIPLLSVYILLKLLSVVKLSPIKYENSCYLYIIALIVSFTYPFFTRTLIEAGSRYQWMITAFSINIRYVGPILIFFLGGLACLIFKKDKKFEELYYLVCILIFIPTMYSHKYGVYLLLIFIIIFVAMGFRNLLALYEKNIISKRILTLFIVLVLLSFTIFSGFYNHARTGDSKNYWYLPEITYKAAEWSNTYIPDNSYGFGLSGDTWRLLPTSDGHPVAPVLSAQILAYRLMNESDIKLVEVDPGSSDYYFEGPYVVEKNTDVGGAVNGFTGFDNIDDVRAMRIVDRFNVTYIIDDIYSPKPIIRSIETKKSNIFNNGRIRVWML